MKKYSPPKPSGVEYVRKADEFDTYTCDTLDKLPKEWKDDYILPVKEITGRISDLTVYANKHIYMKEKDPAVKLSKFEDRVNILTKAHDLFPVFDRRFDKLLSKLDLFSSEQKRIRQIMWNILHEAGAYSSEYVYDLKRKLYFPPWENNRSPSCEELEKWRKRVNGVINRLPTAQIEIEQKPDEITYTAVNGDRKLKLGFTAKKRDNILDLEKAAKDEIGKRISKDRAIIKAEKKTLKSKAV